MSDRDSGDNSATPVRAFRLNHGRNCQIRHPRDADVGPIAIIGLPDDPNYPSFDRTVTVSLLYVQRWPTHPKYRCKAEKNGEVRYHSRRRPGNALTLATVTSKFRGPL